MAACMGTNPVPPPTTPPLPPVPPQATTAPLGAEAEYKSLLSLFKNLVWISGIGLSVITLAASGLVAIGSYFFWANMRDVRQDAKEQAERVAKDESQKRVTQAFDEKNIQAMILKAAQEKVVRHYAPCFLGPSGRGNACQWQPLPQSFVQGVVQRS